MAKTYATWNPSDKGSGISLSGGNLTANYTSTAWQSVRSTIAKSSGKWYWEIGGLSGTAWQPAVASATDAVSTDFASGANSWAYDKSGAIYNNGGTVATGLATFAAGAVIGVALDKDAGTVKFYKDNSLQATISSLPAGTQYAGISLYGPSGGSTAVANFGATSLTYSPPAGYNAGLYDDPANGNFLAFF